MTETEYMSAKIFNELNMGHIEEVRQLLEDGTDVNATNSMTNTLLMEAAYTGQADMVRLLLKAGANPAPKNWYGKSARDLAKELGHQKVLTVFSDLYVTE